MSGATGARERLIDDSLFIRAGQAADPALRGSACPACGTTTFPAQSGCPRCGGGDMAEVALPTTGTIWSATVQHFQPKTPFRHDGEFAPFGVGYVDLGSVLVESRFTENDIEALAIGTPVHLAVVPAFTDEDGTTVLSFAFSPSNQGGQP